MKNPKIVIVCLAALISVSAANMSASPYPSASESQNTVFSYWESWLYGMETLPGTSPQEQYIAKYAPVAVSEMYRSGVPASITLAQGLLESRYGLSRLASEGNNHFGIKCHDWTGRKMYHDDDKKGECFRVYSDAEASFRDHSDFLRYRDRYKFLFENEITDYKAWAYGLKKAGYATDPAYPSKLIKLIEDYDLARFDKMALEESRKIEIVEDKPVKEIKESPKEARRRRVLERKAKKAEKAERRRKRIPLPPAAVEEPVKVSSEKAYETFHFPLSRQLYSQNGVPFIYSVEGETIRSIAQAHSLFVRELLKFNDMTTESELAPGTIVYLQPKKKQAAKGVDKYIVDHEGENLRDIAQRFGVRLKSIMKMNGFAADYTLREGDTIVLRGASTRTGKRKNV